MPWSAAGHRPSWRLGAGKTLCLRYGAPTFYPEDRPVTAQVGAPLPAKPCIFVARRQHFALERSRQPVELAPHCRQSLVPPLRGANILPWSAADHRPSWRPITGKALCLRYEAPTFCPGAQPVTAQVGAPLPAKPCISVARRQNFALERSRQPVELAPHCRQILVPPLRGANILPWSAAGHRPRWRPITGKALCLRCEAPTFCPGARPGHRQSWRPFAGKALCLRYEAPTSCPGARPVLAAQQPAANKQ